MKSLARIQLEMLELPADRLPVVERAAMVVRGALGEKYSWCQHLEQLEDQNYRGNHQLHYTSDPTWQAKCLKHRHESLIQHADAALVIRVFKKRWCETCPDRMPRQRPT